MFPFTTNQTESGCALVSTKIFLLILYITMNVNINNKIDEVNDVLSNDEVWLPDDVWGYLKTFLLKNLWFFYDIYIF